MGWAGPSLTFHVLRRSRGVLLVSGRGAAVAALRLGGVSRAVPHGLHLGLAVLLRGAALAVGLGAAGGGSRSGRRGEGREQGGGAAARRGRLRGVVSGGGVCGAGLGLGVDRGGQSDPSGWFNRLGRDYLNVWGR